VTEWIAALLLLVGALLCLVAAVGVIRLGDVFSRMHAATKAGTLGLALICLAAMLLADDWRLAVECMVVLLFMLATAPIGAHLIGRAAFRSRVKVDPATSVDPETDAFR
jgi:multicomponent Na+:H+ antiporter subunit G